jgi:hypothetical protein
VVVPRECPLHLDQLDLLDVQLCHDLERDATRLRDTRIHRFGQSIHNLG